MVIISYTDSMACLWY